MHSGNAYFCYGVFFSLAVYSSIVLFFSVYMLFARVLFYGKFCGCRSFDKLLIASVCIVVVRTKLFLFCCASCNRVGSPFLCACFFLLPAKTVKQSTIPPLSHTGQGVHLNGTCCRGESAIIVIFPVIVVFFYVSLFFVSMTEKKK